MKADAIDKAQLVRVKTTKARRVFVYSAGHTAIPIAAIIAKSAATTQRSVVRWRLMSAWKKRLLESLAREVYFCKSSFMVSNKLSNLSFGSHVDIDSGTEMKSKKTGEVSS